MMNTGTAMMLLERNYWYPIGIVDPLQEMLAGTWAKRCEEITMAAKQFLEIYDGNTHQEKP